jgi:geranylgeranyl reductase family protein
VKERIFDVAVVGAGPAGSTAARYCAIGGLSTLLLEKERFPREKPCAGGVAVAAAKELGFSLPERLIERRCRGMKVRFRRTENTITSDRDIIYMVRRSVFDEFLAAKAVEAGAELHEAEACTDIEAEPACMHVSTDKGRYRARILIGADGYFSVAAKVVRPPFSSAEVWVCVIAEIPLAAGEIDKRMGNLVEIEYGVINRGYAWIFPKADHISVGVGGLPRDAKILKQTLGRFLRARDLPVPKRVRGCFIPVSRLTSPLGAGHILLAGDAAGLVDSFSGEGIRYAVTSGRFSAEAAIRFISGDGRVRELLGSYESACRRSFFADLRASRRITYFSFRYPRLFLEPTVSDRKALSRYLDTVTGERSLKERLRWLIFRLPLLLAKKVGGVIAT